MVMHIENGKNIRVSSRALIVYTLLTIFNY